MASGKRKRKRPRALIGLSSSQPSKIEDSTQQPRKTKREREKKKHLKLKRFRVQGDSDKEWPKRLFIFDLNGVLIYRSKNKIEGENHAYKDGTNKYVYTRPHVSSLLKWLACERGIAIGIWSSAKRKFVDRQVQLLFPKSSPLHSRLAMTLSQDECRKTGEGKDTVLQKPLQRLWDRYPEWNERNTVIFDDSKEKCEENIGNTVLLETFNPERDQHLDQFSCHGPIWSYLDTLTRYPGDDIRSFLVENQLAENVSSTSN
mmetsp:Transcript_12853/g.16670  ORF Transcript_12853/g.16670 Transcript_12853/m.16670 type:complete len:259 (+) Transcript_12853:59-835(+)